jgi:hypothetical protein
MPDRGFRIAHLSPIRARVIRWRLGRSPTDSGADRAQNSVQRDRRVARATGLARGFLGDASLSFGRSQRRDPLLTIPVTVPPVD